MSHTISLRKNTSLDTYTFMDYLAKTSLMTYRRHQKTTSTYPYGIGVFPLSLLLETKLLRLTMLRNM